MTIIFDNHDQDILRRALELVELAPESGNLQRLRAMVRTAFQEQLNDEAVFLADLLSNEGN